MVATNPFSRKISKKVFTWSMRLAEGKLEIGVGKLGSYLLVCSYQKQLATWSSGSVWFVIRVLLKMNFIWLWFVIPGAHNPKGRSVKLVHVC